MGLDDESAAILVVDDEENIVDVVSAYLRAEGYVVYTAKDGPGALRSARAFKPDLIVLDIMLPGMDGLEVLQYLRRESQVYVILLTAKSEESDKVIGLSVGADDYLTKPFSPRELVARVKAALRRYRQSGSCFDSEILLFKRLRIDATARRVWQDGREIELTPLEFKLLYALAEHRGRALSREQLLERVWGRNFYGYDRVVDTHLARVRKKIERDPTRPTLIVTVRGVGYRFEDLPDEMAP